VLGKHIPREVLLAKYKVLVGLDTPSGRLEAGTVVEHTSIPSKSIKWLTDQNLIELDSGKVEEIPVSDEPANEEDGV